MNEHKTTFFDFPLDQDVYLSRPCARSRSPIRILITDAGQKFVYCLVYKICTGAVFGEKQEVYINLVNSRGVTDHKAIFLELEECGFPLLKGWLVTSQPEEAYENVDIVVLSTSLEELSGFSCKEALVGQIIRGRQMMKHIMKYSKPDVKVVLIGSSTKFVLMQLHIYHRLEPKISPKNITAVTLLDEAIARANLASRLKTTTNKIKDIVVWGMTCPDAYNATVRMLPPGDLGALEEVDVPIHEALNDEKYLQDEFVQCLFRRKIGNEFFRSGKSMAIATARHLKALFVPPSDTEIISMGVITPSSEPYMLPQGYAFSFPVTLSGNGTWEIRENVKYDVITHLNLMRTVHRLLTDKMGLTMSKALEYISDLEEKTNEIVKMNQRGDIAEIVEISKWDMEYLLCPLPFEATPKLCNEKMKMRKSIAWDDRQKLQKRDQFNEKSSIRFISDETKKEERKPSILKHSDNSEVVILPPVHKN